MSHMRVPSLNLRFLASSLWSPDCDDSLTSPPHLPTLRTATALILIFQLSFAADLNYVSCLEVSYRSKQGLQQVNQKKEKEKEKVEEEEDACRLLP